MFLGQNMCGSGISDYFFYGIVIRVMSGHHLTPHVQKFGWFGWLVVA